MAEIILEAGLEIVCDILLAIDDEEADVRYGRAPRPISLPV